MLVALLSIAVFLVLAAVILRWAESDYRQTGKLAPRSTVGAWLLYVFHGDTVASAAWAGALEVTAFPQSAAFVVGLAVGLPGLALFLWATGALGRALQDENGRLVTTGVFALMRHPQNTGWALALTGIAVAGRSVLALALVALFGVFAARYAAAEEKHLANRFGETWHRYRAVTPSVFGFRRPAHDPPPQ